MFSSLKLIELVQSHHWRDALLRHRSSSGRLHEAVAALSRLLCNSIVPWDNIRALIVSHLIALDKCPGVRPFGFGEIFRRIVGKAICLVTCSDTAVVCGKYQLCVGLQSGIEGAIHAMNELFETLIGLSVHHKIP